MGPYEKTLAGERSHLIVHDRTHAQPFETLNLHPIVDNIAQSTHTAPLQSLFGERDRPHHTEAETRPIIYFDIHRRKDS